MLSENIHENNFQGVNRINKLFRLDGKKKSNRDATAILSTTEIHHGFNSQEKYHKLSTIPCTKRDEKEECTDGTRKLSSNYYPSDLNMVRKCQESTLAIKEFPQRLDLRRSKISKNDEVISENCNSSEESKTKNSSDAEERKTLNSDSINYSSSEVTSENDFTKISNPILAWGTSTSESESHQSTHFKYVNKTRKDLTSPDSSSSQIHQ